MKILVVDDVDYIRKSISKVLESNNFICDVAENGRIAIEKLNQSETLHDLIITDIMMPDMDGFELLDYLRAQSGSLGKIPVLAISGGSKTIDSDLALKMINEKADLVLQKPFAKADLLQAIAQVIGNSKLNKTISSI